ncbi:hypothetical protein CLV36_102107 [Laceyella sediminis]|uniref:Uncharacterized protein n=1 Tax=Laceyella sediminis TaxID=573074 RepID=A0ABX5ES43_9BACL|nr:hypothetical protein [Laceyella sediminis]PRZ16399.1 hypothetical protein CLV36_102107 [Laceyella sediminis]
MVRLEYRLCDEKQGFPGLFGYSSLSNGEVLMRFACDYLVKGTRVYEKTSTAIEGDLYVIYVIESPDEDEAPSGPVFMPDWVGICMEVRHFREGMDDYPLVHRLRFYDPQEALLHLLGDYLMIGDQEWEKTSTEVDENRKVYVIYAKPTTEE